MITAKTIGERWTEPGELKQILHIADATHSGPILFSENGKLYCDTSDSHVLVSGKTRSGKTSTEILPFVYSELQAKKGVIVVDPKGEITKHLLPIAKKTHKTFCLDFRHPSRSPDHWNPIESCYKLFKTGDREKMDIASTMISSLTSALYPSDDSRADPFWHQASARLLEGLIYGLIELCDEEYCNLSSIVSMFEQLETKICGSFAVKEFYNFLPENFLARKALSTYITAGQETRSSIHSVASSGIIGQLSQGLGIMQILSNGTFNIHEIDVEEPFFFSVILPDETSNVYSSICGLFIAQITQHLIRLAEDKYAGKLPRRVSIFVEELGSIAGAVPNLPLLLAGSLGRNIRVCLVMQNPYSQLNDIYGPAKAKSIQSNIGTTIAFSSNDFESLQILANNCGERIIEWDGRIIKEPLITPTQIAALNTGCCLITIQNRYKYITKLPFYTDTHKVDKNTFEIPPSVKKCNDTPNKAFNMFEYVKAKKEEQIRLMAKQHQTQETQKEESNNGFNMDSLIAKIDKRISEIEAEEKLLKEEAKND